VRQSLFRRVEYPERGELIYKSEAVSSQQEIINSRETVPLYESGVSRKRGVDIQERGSKFPARNYQFSWDSPSSGELSILKEGSWYTGERL
jgi:hypothetical protein